MSNYMRTMIYLRTWDEDKQSMGYLRLERKGGYLLFSLVLTGETNQENWPIYVIGDWNTNKKSYCLRKTGDVPDREGRVLLSQLPLWLRNGKICAALVGTKERYLAGTVDCHVSMPGWEELDIENEREQEAVEIQAAEEIDEREEKSSICQFFEDDEMVWCRPIEPRDISNLNMEEWYLAANSFLLQGYYNYHHLIHASDGEKEYLGVPGQYQRRESYMAKRFGFPFFKAHEKKEAQVGDFGYWLRVLPIR